MSTRKRNKFSLSYQHLLSCDMGKLIPIGLTEVLPNDTIQLSTTGLVRCAPLVTPVMARADIRIHHFFVPHRLVWEDWEKFITGGDDGRDNSELPTVSSGSTGFEVGSLADYMGLPTGIANMNVSALPFRAYNMIFNEYYRDEDLVDPLSISKASGADTTTSMTLQNCAWEKDYFTSARPFAQKGDFVSIPLSADAAQVTGDVAIQGNGVPLFSRMASSARVAGALSGTDSSNTVSHYPTGGGGTGFQGLQWTDPKLKGTLEGKLEVGSLGGIDISDLRTALSLQRFQEARARYGSRYTEYLRYLGVISSDARLQRPEYLGGGRTVMQFSEILQTSETANTPLGSMAGHGVGAVRSNRFRRFFEEHGYIVSLLSIRPKTVYTSMTNKTWLRKTKEDFFQPEFQHIGQQEILNKEVYAGHSQPDGVFGYQDRYNEYRYHESNVSGEFRTTLKSWHMGREFSGDVALNEDFITCTPTDRIFAASARVANTIYCYFNHSIQARRAMVKVANPKII